jgi:hypothetical protein
MPRRLRRLEVLGALGVESNNFLCKSSRFSRVFITRRCKEVCLVCKLCRLVLNSLQALGECVDLTLHSIAIVEFLFGNGRVEIALLGVLGRLQPLHSAKVQMKDVRHKEGRVSAHG